MFFYDPTPISKKREGGADDAVGIILPYSPVNMIGRIAAASRPANVQEFLKLVEKSHVKRKVPMTLSSPSSGAI